MTTKLSHAARSASSVQRSARSKAPISRARMSKASASVFRPGACAAQSSWPNQLAGGAGGHDQVVVGQGAAVVQLHLTCGDVDRARLGLQHRQPAAAHLAPQDVADGRRHGRGRKAGGGHLVQQRLEQVVVGAVDQRDLDRCPRQHAHRFQPAEPAADDDDVGQRHAHSVAGARECGASPDRNRPPCDCTPWRWHSPLALRLPAVKP
jgi:hypothetical protein